MKNFKVGQRVVGNGNFGGFPKGHKGTVMELPDNNGYCFINTDKLNPYNHRRHGGNGLLVHYSQIEALNTSGQWTPDEVDYLHTNYRRKPIEKIAEELNRTYYSVQSKARSEKIHKHPRREYNDRDNLFIRHSYMDGISPLAIGEQLHRSPSSILSRIDLMNERKQLPTIIPREV